jgi:hypothetical protein
MRPAIQDEFMNLPISRQQKYRLRMKRDGRCIQCGERAIGGNHCVKHMVQWRERQRTDQGRQRRYHNSLSYWLQGRTEPAVRSALPG